MIRWGYISRLVIIKPTQYNKRSQLLFAPSIQSSLYSVVIVVVEMHWHAAT